MNDQNDTDMINLEDDSSPEKPTFNILKQEFLPEISNISNIHLLQNER